MQDLERVRYVSANYDRLQGLRLVPLALLFYLVAFRDSGFDWTPYWLQPGDQTVVLPAFLLVGLLYLLIGRWYRQAFGRVAGAQAGWWQNIVWFVGGIGCLFVYFFAAWFDVTSRPPISFHIMSMAALLVVYWWVSGRFRSHYLVVAAVVVCISLLPLFGVIDTMLLSRVVGSSIIAGTVLISVGILDHLLLVRTMRPVPEESGGGAV